jgi:DNA-binding NarL/FixJ family response regulator
MINVLIVEDHPLVIEGLKRILEADGQINIFGVASNEKTFRNLFATFEEGVILLDIKLPDCNGIELCKQIRGKSKNIQVVVLTTFAQEYYVRSMLENGAISYILKDAPPSEIINAVYKASEGLSSFSKSIERSMNSSKEQGVFLSKREIQVIQLIAEGLTNNEIGEKLFLSPLTIDSHRKNLILKLGVKNTAALVKAASEGGWLD